MNGLPFATSPTEEALRRIRAGAHKQRQTEGKLALLHNTTGGWPGKFSNPILTAKVNFRINQELAS
ncbi:MAG: hypothetical protein SFZ03_05805 [Candidatus Melainabacteria bacterium]|nr:hypothetical protein [Candidatus Melainabacteria bacterium]